MRDAAAAVNRPTRRRALTAIGPTPRMSTMIRTAAYRYYYYYATPLTGRWSRTR